VFTVFPPFEAASKVLSENMSTARAVIIEGRAISLTWKSRKNVNELLSE